MQAFSCGHCGHTVYFDNHQCGACGAALGYLPNQAAMGWCAPGAHRDQRFEPQAQWMACGNRWLAPACNWLVEQAGAQLCASCRLTTRIPDLSMPGHAERWRRTEQAKRRIVYTLIELGLGPDAPDASTDGPALPDGMQPLCFHLLADEPGQAPVMTGHDHGVITINLAEADPVLRETARVALGEPVRSLLGHMRHEVAHYLQARWLNQGTALAQCREVFGDEQQDYAAALARHHQQGAPADWQDHYITAYASCHPWEDWAETCAHLLLVQDGLETAVRWGLQLQGSDSTVQPQDPSQLDGPGLAQCLVQQWLPVAQFLNAMSRSLGLPDSYPYLMPNPVLHKLSTAHALLRQAAGRG